ncbi:aldehyde dehydrogenase [Aureimonas fodinaquatilis]|uniref:Aldehyde dehydrogenase n=1 Tax=Aureimonas fodinaquatilis TaxID=2565783 RepID=A0A5B0E3C4_9HYPH|nr:aldehyde dehydrogenase [Aureimonas fodinaquatilis]KAA0971889.1 aldehyde dehydrogenase [Aureimonas fodinaquatilis]
MSEAISANLHSHASPPVRGLYIDGREQPVGDRETFAIYAPGTGDIIAHTVHATDDDVDMAIQSARRAFENPDWRDMSLRSRANLVHKIGDLLEKYLDELATLESLNNGRPTRETRAQLAKLPDLFRYNAGLALSRRDAVIPVDGNYLSYTLRQPVGVVANVTPFNHPLFIVSRNLAPTFASGCTTVVKPSEYTPLTTLRIAEICTEAGLPDGVFNVVTGFGATTGKALSGHPDINKLVLTGGTESGRLAGAAAARNFAHQTLELGGKAPVLVFDDFDVNQAVDYAAFGAFIGAGQTCVCASRHLVQRTVYDEFVEKLAAKAKSLRVGDPFDRNTHMGPVISERQRTRVLDFVKIGLDEGARLVAGGGIPQSMHNSAGFYVEPTVFADVKPEMRIAREEVFGPFTVVLPFDTEEEALRIANDSEYGLAAAVRTQNIARAHRLASQLEAGIIWINDHHRVDIAAPWGGVKASGTGREFGQESFDHYFHTKAVTVNMSNEPFDWFEAEMRDLRLN